VSKEAERFAWLVLQAVNRTQTKGSTARLAVPRDPEVVDQLGIVVTEKELLKVEEYLENRGYLELADISLTRGTYTITPAGLRWLEDERSGTLESTGTDEEASEGAEPQSSTVETHEAVQRSWFRRVFEG
jgi:hypothetical protein